MKNFLNSLKSDLLDRRMRPVLAVVCVALLGAVAFTVFGGGSSSSTVPAPVGASASSVKAGAIVVSEAKTSTDAPIAETTSGSSQQTGGGSTRNPFAPVPGSQPKASATAASSGTSAGASSSGASSGSSGGGEASSGSQPATSQPSEEKPSQKKQSQPAKPRTVYRVAVLFGVAAPGTPPQSAQLTPYEDLKRQQPLPSDAQPLVVFRGVIAGGKSATFTLVGEAILRGTAACLPSASQCESIDLKPGQTEELEYVPPGGTAITYQLQVVSIQADKAKASAARNAFASESKSGLKLLRSAGLDELPGLRYSSAKGVLVFAGHPAFAARAHVAAWGASL